MAHTKNVTIQRQKPDTGSTRPFKDNCKAELLLEAGANSIKYEKSMIYI